MSSSEDNSLVSAMRAAVVNLAKVELSALSDAALLELARQLRPVTCQLQAVEIRLAGALDSRGAAATAGTRSTTAWIRNELRVADAAIRLRSARALIRMPRLAAAFDAGAVSAEHVAVVAKVSAELSDQDLASGAEDLLVRRACELAPARLRRIARRVRDQYVSDSSDRAGGTELGNRWLHTRRTADGGLKLTGRLDAEAGTRFMAAIDRAVAQVGPVEMRTLPVLRAAALLRLCGPAGRRSPASPVAEIPSPTSGPNPSAEPRRSRRAAKKARSSRRGRSGDRRRTGRRAGRPS
jgi:hypothetical protein